MKKVKYIVLALVLVLGLIGGAYAMWSETFTVDATATAATFEVKFENPCDIVDDEKGVAVTTCDVVDDGKKLEVTVNNAYPGYWSDVKLNIENNSSIPVKVTRLEFNGDYEIEDEILAELEGVVLNEVIDEETVQEVIVKINVLSEAQQNQTYNFTVELDFSQWQYY